jgi:DNA gyrase/topoisomerase IV subunit B
MLGLGEMNPTVRPLLRLLIGDAINADRFFVMLMDDAVMRSQYLQFTPQEPS